MPLGKDDAPANKASTASTADKKDNAAANAAIDAVAGAPPAMREAAEELPEKDDVQKAHKDLLLADDAQTEAKAKVKLVEESPDAAETPSGKALLKTAGIADDVKRGEEYTRIKTAVRHGYVPADEKDLA